jgi:hypothetical protein
MGNDSGGVLLIRAWIEQGSAEPLRARIQATIGLSQAPASSHALAGVDDVLEVVRAWLQQILPASLV